MNPCVPFFFILAEEGNEKRGWDEGQATKVDLVAYPSPFLSSLSLYIKHGQGLCWLNNKPLQGINGQGQDDKTM